VVNQGLLNVTFDLKFRLELTTEDCLGHLKFFSNYGCSTGKFNYIGSLGDYSGGRDYVEFYKVGKPF